LELRADERSEGTRLSRGDWGMVADSPIFPPASFDFVVAFDVLEHLPRIGEDLNPAHRHQGRLIWLVPLFAGCFASAQIGPGGPRTREPGANSEGPRIAILTVYRETA
jgi:hypothetical protein